MTTVRDRLIQCFSLVFPELPETEIPLASSASLGAWNSLANLSLITILEEEFGMKVDEAEVELFVSFDLVFEYVKGKVNGGA
jgi:acyl carrier protein